MGEGWFLWGREKSLDREKSLRAQGKIPRGDPWPGEARNASLRMAKGKSCREVCFQKIAKRDVQQHQNFHPTLRRFLTHTGACIKFK